MKPFTGNAKNGERLLKQFSESTQNITPASLALFLRHAQDAANWSGDAIYTGDQRDNGNLVQLKKAGLVNTFKDRGCVFLEFTTAGRELAAKHGITI